MALIMNACNKEVSVQVHGNWFTFKPKQIKTMDDNKVFFLASNCAYMGFVQLPEQFEDLEYRASAEGKKALAEFETKGVEARVQYLTYLKNNELNALRKDLERNNDKSDPRAYMSPKMVENLEELASYKRKLEAEKKEQIAKIAELEKLLED